MPIIIAFDSAADRFSAQQKTHNEFRLKMIKLKIKC